VGLLIRSVSLPEMGKRVLIKRVLIKRVLIKRVPIKRALI
jgi:hypothetical protein